MKTSGKMKRLMWALLCIGAVIGTLYFTLFIKLNRETNERQNVVQSSQEEPALTTPESTSTVDIVCVPKQEEPVLKFPESRSKETMQKLDILSEEIRVVQEKEWETSIQLANKIPEGEDRNRALADIACSLSSNDIEKAIQLIGQIPEGEFRYGTLVRVARNCAYKDPDKALQIACYIPEGEDRNGLRR